MQLLFVFTKGFVLVWQMTFITLYICKYINRKHDQFISHLVIYCMRRVFDVTKHFQIQSWLYYLSFTNFCQLVATAEYICWEITIKIALAVVLAIHKLHTLKLQFIQWMIITLIIIYYYYLHVHTTLVKDLEYVKIIPEQDDANLQCFKHQLTAIYHH